MILINVGGYKSTNARNLGRGYQEPSIVNVGMLDHINGHVVRPNMVALKYPNFKKDVDLDALVRAFNFAMKANVETFEEYIINAFNYKLRDTTLNWCHNYMSKFHDYTFSELT